MLKCLQKRVILLRNVVLLWHSQLHRQLGLLDRDWKLSHTVSDCHFKFQNRSRDVKIQKVQSDDPSL